MKLILSVFTFCLIANIALATTYYSNPAGGNFNASIWSTSASGPFTTAGTSITTSDDVVVQGGTLVLNVASPCRNITVQSGTTVTINIAVTLSGDMTVQNGGIVQLGPTGSNTGSLTLQNLTVDNGGKLWGNDPVNASAGNVKTIRINGTLITCNGTIGDGANNDALLLQPEGATVTITGAGTIDVARIRKGASTNVTTNLIIDADVNVRFGTTCVYNNQNTTAFNITVNAAKMLKCIAITNPTGFSGTEGSISLNGTTGGSNRRQGLYTINGTLECEYLYIAATSTTNTDVFKYLVSSTGTIKVNNQLKGNSATGTTSATADLQLLSGASLKLLGITPTASIDGTSTKNKFLFDAASTVEYGASNQSIENGFGSYGNLKLTGSGTKTLSGAITINGLLAVNAGTLSTGANALTLGASASATFSPTTALSVDASGSVDFNGRSVTLQSSIAGTARIGQVNGSLLNATNVTTQTFIPSGRRAFRFLGHPFSNTLSISSLIDNVFITGAGTGFDATTTNNPSAFWFNNVTNAWAAFTSTTDANWGQYKGMRILVRGDRTQTGTLTGSAELPNAVTLDITGSVNIGAANISLPTAGNYHFVSNPYPSPTNIGAVIDATANIGTQYWVWDANASIKGAYVTRTVGGGAYNLAMNGSFIVQPTATTALAFTEAHKTAVATSTLFRNQPNGMMELQLLYNDYPADNLFIRLNETSSSDIGATDGLKLTQSDMNFYTIVGSKKLSLDTRPLDKEGTIQLGLSTNINDNYKIKIAGISFNNNVEMFLKDRFTNTLTPIAEGMEYVFAVTNDAASKGDNRFEIVMKQLPLLASMAAALDVSISPNPVKDQMTVSYATTNEAEASIKIVNGNGQVQETITLGKQQQGRVAINTGKWAAGTYIVELLIGKEKLSKQVVKL